VIAVAIVGVNAYRLWTGGSWDLPKTGKGAPIAAVEVPSEQAKKSQTVSTDIIISKNIFDPERGEGRSREAADNSRSSQRVRSMVLLGTAILGNDRVAILQDAPAARGGAATTAQPSEIMRVKLGDTVEGFRLSEIGDKRVVFTKGGSRVEVMLDFFRKVETVEPKPPPQTPAQVTPPRPVVPRVVPNLPRRPAAPPDSTPES
jgi:hypothetical protein